MPAVSPGSAPGYAGRFPRPTIIEMDPTWILIDEHTGLHVSWYFWLRVLDEVNRSTRYGTPFALLLLEAEAGPAGRGQRQMDDAASTVPQAIRSTDLGGAVGAGRVAVLLTHQDSESAEQARDRILERMAAAAGPGSVQWSARLLAYPDDAADIAHLLTDGWGEDQQSLASLSRPA